MPLRTLILLLLFAPFAAVAADLPAGRSDGTEDVSRFLEPDKAASRDSDPAIGSPQGFHGSISVGGQWQSATSPAFNRYGKSAIPGSDSGFTFEGKR